jgi:hypothetical protein
LNRWQATEKASTAFASMTNGACAFVGRAQDAKTLKLRITISDGVVAMSFKNGMRTVHPGEVLRYRQ